ncbi:hypothetical protein MTO96_032755 [Rhipicephalus appendiculatus]
MPARDAASPRKRSNSVYHTASEHSPALDQRRPTPVALHPGKAHPGHAGGSAGPPVSKRLETHQEHGGRALNAAGPTGAPAPTATARAASSAAPGDGADEVDLWEDHSWQRCLIVYVILVGIIGLALIVFVTVGSTAKHHGLEQTTRRAFTRINPQAKVLASSNESSRLPSPVTVEGDHVAHVPTAAATLVDEGDDAEEDTTTEN